MVTLQDAKKVAQALIDDCHPWGVIVFGSVAQKGQGNDLDLLIIVNEAMEKNRPVDLSIHTILKRFYKDFSIDPFIIPVSLFQEYYAKGSPFLWSIVKEGKYLYMKNAIEEWLKQAEEELNTAEYLLEGGYYKGACYHAQQAIEKRIKALLLQKGWELEKTHTIGRLVAIGEDFNLKLNLTDEDIIFIYSIYRSRYPSEAGLLPLGEAKKAEAEMVIALARRIKN